jgi:hypothetical protein
MQASFRFAPPHQTPLGWVNDFQDLAVDKLLAFFGRAEPRDAVDLFAILQTEDVWELTRLALQKDPGFDLYGFAQALQKTQGFPDELERWPVELVHPLDSKQLKQRFQEMALEIMARLKRA